MSVYDRELSVSRLSTQLICMTRTLADILIVKSEFSCIDVFFISFNQVTCLSYLILLLLLFLIIFNYTFFFPIGGPLAVRRPQAPACIAYASGRPSLDVCLTDWIQNQYLIFTEISICIFTKLSNVVVTREYGFWCSNDLVIDADLLISNDVSRPTP